MSSRTLASRLLTRATRPTTTCARSAIRSPIPQPQITPRSKSIQTRLFSHTPRALKQSPAASSEADLPSDIKSYDFHSISSLVAKPDASRMIIDVREPAELQQSGRVPGAQNVPINSAPDGLFLPAEEFEDRFGFEKPAAETEVVFYCKAGVRSRAAARVAKMAGWQKVGEYPGSWVDWEKNGGQVQK